MATVTSSTTLFADNFKTLFAPERVQEIVDQEAMRPATALLKKTKIDALTNTYAVNFDLAPGGSFTFSHAQSNGSAPSVEGFTLSPKEAHRVLTIGSKEMHALKSNQGAFLRDQALKGSSMVGALANDIEVQLFGAASGARGVISSGSATTTITLTNASDARKWAVGDSVVFADSESAALTSATPLTVSKVDRIAGTLTLSAAPSTLGVGDGEYLYREGDYVSAGDRLGMYSFGDYLPATVAAGDSFCGVNRSQDRNRLAGVAVSVDAGNIGEGLEQGIMDVYAVSGYTPTDIFVSVTNMRKLRVQGAAYTNLPAGGGMVLGHNSVVIESPVASAPIKVRASAQCSDSDIFGIHAPSWELIHLGPSLVHLDQMDGNEGLRSASAAAIEFRFASYPQLRCLAPGRNFRGVVA